MTDERQQQLERLEAALAPFTEEARELAFNEGVDRGVLNVYTMLLRWSVSEPKADDTERNRRIQATTETMKLMEERYPIIRKTYPEG
jgi:hypothetical protein